MHMATGVIIMEDLEAALSILISTELHSNTCSGQFSLTQ